jgi:glycosyltransferase involved in cell wall biosynthesis
MQGKSVVYVALGGRRVGAAARHTARMVADGARVVLVIAVLDEWAGVPIEPAVTVHRVGPGKLRETLRSARRLLLGDGGPLRDADLLIAGDPEAMPVAWAVGRRHPELSIRLEPAADPSRGTAAADLAVLTPWYPSPDDSFAGAFVQAATAAVRPDFDRVAILHTESWFYTPTRVAGQRVGVAAERQTSRSGNAVVLDTPEGELTRVAVPSAAGAGYLAYADAQVEGLRATLPTGRIEAPLVHAHTGMLGGVVATRLARPDARIVVTEHATFLPTVFEQPGARRRYAEMLERVDVLLCVGRYLYDQLSEYFPDHVDKLRIVPNAVDFDRFAVRPEPPRELLRWLYVGRMVEHKGVLTLVDGFARIAAEEPCVSLTLVGSGPLEDAIDERITALGLRDRITRRPAVQPDEVTSLMHEHDLLVHASRLETFGMTVVEAIATGTPVLVARSQGPRETLAGLEDRAGLLIEPSDDPDVIAEGYRTLRARLDVLDLPRARAELSARYGFEAVAAQLREVYAAVCPSADSAQPERDVTPESSSCVPADRVVVVNINPLQVDRTRKLVHQLMDRGIGVDLITAEPWAARRAPGDPIRVHELGAVESRRLLVRLEQLLVFAVPVGVLSAVQRVAARIPAPWPEAVVRFLRRVHRRIAQAAHRRIFLRGYSVVRPRILWQITRREALPNLDLSRIRRVVVVDAFGVPIGWQLGRRCPQVPVTTSRSWPEAAPAVDG